MPTTHCPKCEEGDVDLRLEYARPTRHYPGHKEIEITYQTCSCDISPDDFDWGELADLAADEEADAREAYYDAKIAMLRGK